MTTLSVRKKYFLAAPGICGSGPQFQFLLSPTTICTVWDTQWNTEGLAATAATLRACFDPWAYRNDTGDSFHVTDTTTVLGRRDIAGISLHRTCMGQNGDG